jgi:Dolichyl-phosphate-mannose-protein mannosyltransferase
MAAGRWPLVLVLAVQAALSLRMVWNHTASTDEALYLWSGHLEWLHLLHGLPLPPFPTYFSGAPVIYPPLAALANAVGGLAAARILSLGFMLVATALLWATTSLLFDRTAAFFSAGLWAVLGPTQFLGSYATYDAMSLCLLALATWGAAHARRDRLMARWLIMAAVAITLANAAKYASMLFDPVVALVALLAVWPDRGTWWKQHKRAAKHAALHLAIVLVIAADFEILAMFLGGGWYETGIAQTTFSRVPGDSTARIVLICSGIWVGAVIVAALLGVVVCVTRDRRQPGRLLLLAILVGAALLAPAEQARIDTLTSLDKHVDFGAWFAAIAAGYGISRLISFLRSPTGRALACAGAAAALALPAVTGVYQANQIFGQYGNSSALVAMLRPLIQANRGPILMDYGSVPEYYLGVRDWKQWSSTSSLRLPSGRTASSPVGTTGNPALYQEYVRRGYFSLVILAFGGQGSINRSIIATINEIPAYHFAGQTWYGSQKYGAWVYDPGARS